MLCFEICCSPYDSLRATSDLTVAKVGEESGILVRSRRNTVIVVQQRAYTSSDTVVGCQTRSACTCAHTGKKRALAPDTKSRSFANRVAGFACGCTFKLVKDGGNGRHAHVRHDITLHGSLFSTCRTGKTERLVEQYLHDRCTTEEHTMDFLEQVGCSKLRVQHKSLSVPDRVPRSLETQLAIRVTL